MYVIRTYHPDRKIGNRVTELHMSFMHQVVTHLQDLAIRLLSDNREFTFLRGHGTRPHTYPSIVVIGGETHTITRVEKTDDTAKLEG